MYVSEIVNHFQIALKGPAKGITILKGIVEGQEFIIATLSSSRLISEKLNAEHPNQRVNLKFSKDCMFVSFEVVGENEVDVIGYVTGLDATKLMSLKEAMEMSDASDDEEYECSECDVEDTATNMRLNLIIRKKLHQMRTYLETLFHLIGL